MVYTAFLDLRKYRYVEDKQNTPIGYHPPVERKQYVSEVSKVSQPIEYDSPSTSDDWSSDIFNDIMW